MNRRIVAGLAIAALSFSAAAWADEGEGEKKAEEAAPAASAGMEIFKSPILVFQPGVAMSFNNPAPDTFGANFLARFLMLVPTSIDWVLPLLGAQWTPATTPAGGVAFFYGLAFALPFINAATGGWLSTLLIPVGAYAGGTNIFIGELAVLLNIGKMMGTMMTPLSGMAIYCLVDEVFYTSAANFAFDATPAVTVGLSIPIAPWK